MIPMRLTWTAVVATLLSVLFIGSVAAFLLYVPVFTIITVLTIVVGLIVTFGLGVVAGGRRIRLKRHKDSFSSPQGVN